MDAYQRGGLFEVIGSFGWFSFDGFSELIEFYVSDGGFLFGDEEQVVVDRFGF